MIKLSGLVPPCIIGMSAYSPSVRTPSARNITEAEASGKPQPAVNAAPAPSSTGQKPTQIQEPSVDSTIDSVEADSDAIDMDNITLDSNTGLAFLLAKLITMAKDDNQLDALAASFVEKLRIKDFDLFKKETAPYSNIEGYSQLLNSISSMIGGSDNSNSGSDDRSNGGGANNQPKDKVNETKWKNYRPLNK
jgi:hypothetical protein